MILNEVSACGKVVYSKMDVKKCRARTVEDMLNRDNLNIIK